MRVAPIPPSLAFGDDDKPYVECIRGRLEPKLSPKRRHGIVQGRLWALLEAWAAGRGDVATEWRFYLVGRGQEPSSLVPDVAYVSFERLPAELPDDARERPRIAPDLAVEIWSPGDRRATLDEKVELYLAHGARAVVVVDPEQHTIEVRHASGGRSLADAGTVAIDGVEGLSIDVDALCFGL